MTVAANRQWRLKRRPRGQFDPADFELATVPVPEVRDGQFLVHLTHLSVDPTQRIWAHEESYLPIQPIGEVMRSIAAGGGQAQSKRTVPCGNSSQRDLRCPGVRRIGRARGESAPARANA